jgi:SWI/SNF-related matrix-associated actin-dependent regulator 1 of chromatin subfamily A
MSSEPWDNVVVQMPTPRAPQTAKPQGKRASLDGNIIRIHFPYDPVTVARVKQLPNRRFISDQPKHWTCTATASAIVKLREMGFALDDGLVQRFGRDLKLEGSNSDAPKAKRLAASITANIKPVPRTIPGFLGILLPFQCEGVAAMDARGGRVLLADEQGLGKSIQLLAFLALHPELRPVVLVVPATAKWDWEAKALQFLEHPDVEVLSGENPYQPTGRLLIINYDILAKGPKDGPTWVDVLLALEPKFVAADEAQYVKNNEAQRTKALKRLKKGRPFCAITGTPGDRPKEVYNAISMVDSSIFANEWTYLHRYTNAQHNGFGWDFTGATHVEELHEILRSTIMLRRLKKDVLPELPDKQYSMVPIDLSAKGKREYERVHKAFMDRYAANIVKLRATMKAEGKTKEQIAARIKGARNAKAVVELEGLKQAAAAAKMDSTIDWIRTFLESGQKLVCFATHKAVIDSVMKAFPGISVKVDGEVTGRKRFDAIERFQNDPTCTLFVGNFEAAGVNVTLTAASNVAILELPQRPTKLMQAEDRTHRIGQKNAVNIYFLLGRGTVEVPLARRLDKMRDVVKRMMDGEPLEEDALIGDLFDAVLEEAA